MTREDARWWENLLFKTGWFTFMGSWLAIMATALVGFLTTADPWGGYPPMWMMVPPFIGLALIFAAIIVGEIGGAWKLD